MYDLSGFCKIQQKGMPQLTISLGSTKPAADLLIRASEGAQKRWGGGAFLVTETELLSNLFISMIPELLQSFSKKKNQQKKPPQFELHAHKIPVVPKILFNSKREQETTF